MENNSSGRREISLVRNDLQFSRIISALHLFAIIKKSSLFVAMNFLGNRNDEAIYARAVYALVHGLKKKK